jgi:hypothetical protein
LVHLQRVYPVIAPYLKGFHLTLDSWREGRDDDGWKIPGWHPEELPSAAPNAPDTVLPVPRLADDLNALAVLFTPDTPPRRAIRSQAVTTCIYGFADASGAGFGSSLQLPTGSISYRYGLWGKDAEGSSSNYRELRNIVECLESESAAGHLSGHEVFLFTDNTTAESAYYKGNSTSRLLFELILRLRTLEMSHQLLLHVVHVAGARMISQGTDGLSRGDFSSGVMGGQAMTHFVPLHLSAIARSPTLLDWVRSWAPRSSITPLTPTEWFTKGHGLSGGFRDSSGLWQPTEDADLWFLWDPAPAAGSAVVQELGVSRHKRTQLGHIFLCPRLFTQKWRRRLHNIADLIFELPAGRRPCWPLEMHEPLIVGLTFPFSTSSPWQHRRSSRLLALERSLRDVWQDPQRDERIILRELCSLT